MKTLIVLSALAVSLVGGACKSSKNAATSSTAQSVEIPMEPFLRAGPELYPATLAVRIERTSCFGTCPVYTAVVYADGQGRYEGRHHSDPEGRFSFVLSSEQMAQITAKANEINYFGLEDDYTSSVTDFPTCYTYLSVDGKRKQISDRHKAPKELREFEKLVDEVIFSAEFVALESSE